MSKFTFILLLVFGWNSIMYAQQSYPVTFTHVGKTVYGTFTTPDGPGKFPVIIINPGSGANDRDGTIHMTGENIECLYPDLVDEVLTPYKDLSDALVQAGFSVLRYDKLEYTYPTNLGFITFNKLWLPVESAITFIKTRDDVDTNRIILLGHSEGSALIPFIAKGRTDIKALISIAGARTPFDSLLAYQLVYIAKQCGGDTALAHTQADQILSYFNTIRTNTWNIGTPSIFGVPAAAWYDYVLATDPVADNYNMDNVCTLFVGMGLDINVPPAELERFKNEITITDDFWSIPGHIHFMTPYNDPQVSKTLTDTIIYWLNYHCLQTGTHDPIPTAIDFLQVSPNPFSSSISILVKGSNAGKLSYSMSDVLNNRIMERLIPNPEAGYAETIDLSDLPGGVYFLSVKIGELQIIKKIIKL